MRSAFLVFDLVSGNATSECDRNARGSVHPKFDDGEKAIELVVGEECSRVLAGKASPKATGRIRVILRLNASWYQYVVARINSGWPETGGGEMLESLK
jgi:hypothetical protein